MRASVRLIDKRQLLLSIVPCCLFTSAVHRFLREELIAAAPAAHALWQRTCVRDASTGQCALIHPQLPPSHAPVQSSTAPHGFLGLRLSPPGATLTLRARNKTATIDTPSGGLVHVPCVHVCVCVFVSVLLWLCRHTLLPPPPHAELTSKRCRRRHSMLQCDAIVVSLIIDSPCVLSLSLIPFCLCMSACLRACVYSAGAIGLPTFAFALPLHQPPSLSLSAQRTGRALESCAGWLLPPSRSGLRLTSSRHAQRTHTQTHTQTQAQRLSKSEMCTTAVRSSWVKLGMAVVVVAQIRGTAFSRGCTLSSGTSAYVATGCEGAEKSSRRSRTSWERGERSTEYGHGFGEGATCLCLSSLISHLCAVVVPLMPDDGERPARPRVHCAAALHDQQPDQSQGCHGASLLIVGHAIFCLCVSVSLCLCICPCHSPVPHHSIP